MAQKILIDGATGGYPPKRISNSICLQRNKMREMQQCVLLGLIKKNKEGVMAVK